jgi:SPP1 family predicted phage head-tail adaptor
MTFRAGELDQRITFQERVDTPDGYGGSTFTWADIPELSSVWAHIRVSGGRESVEYQRVNAETVYLFVIRNRSDLQASYRLMWEGEPFSIKSVKKPKSRALYLEIDGERGAPQ